MPKTVKVGVHTYSILRKSKSQMGDDLGTCDFNELQILLRKQLRKSVSKETLIHEILHAATYPSLNEKTMTDEDFVTAVSPVLLQVLQDNPELVEYLTQ
jgi:hypothetical protein